jgi:hypothetical protein
MNRKNRIGLIYAVCIILIAAYQSAVLAQGRQEEPSGLEAWLYIPLVKRETLGINGYVTMNGAPIAGIPLDLRFFNGSDWSTAASTTTDDVGQFRFLNAGTLGSNQAYYVRFLTDDVDPNNYLGYLTTWHTKVIESYTEGASVHIGDFDIKDIVLLTPASGAAVDLPRTFTWQKRTASPSDRYEFNLFDEADGDPWFWTDPPLGFVSSYVLQGLPDGFDTETFYLWYMWVYDHPGGLGFGGYGYSYWARWVGFNNTGDSTGLVPAGDLLVRNIGRPDLSSGPIPEDFEPGD